MAGQMGAEPKELGSVGPYKLLSLLGQGGMGRVYLAEQLHPVRRKVALKVIHSAFVTPAMEARFRLEHKSLARLQHPNIAALYDSGYEDGRPYFAMEYVDGMDFVRYCDHGHLSVRARLRLFMDVCAAVHHAHQRGILHRDIKPQNILVSEIDGMPVAKVIDFGISKWMHANSPFTQTEETGIPSLTGSGTIVGTLGYMSPEQIHPDEVVDTRADVYGLGAVLYHVLTGRPPFDTDSLGDVPLAAAVIKWQRHQITRPSSKILKSGERLLELAKYRNTSAAKLPRQIRLDLDWVVMKALERDKERRYVSAEEFRRDVENFLQQRPVMAGPPSPLYVARKFLERNFKVVTALSLFFIAVVIGVARTSQAQKSAKANALRAEQETQKARQSVSLMQELLGSVDPAQHGAEVTFVDVLQAFENRMGFLEAVEPGVRAELRLNLGITYRRLGLLEKADAQFEEMEHILAGEEVSDSYVLLFKYNSAQLLAHHAFFDKAESYLKDVLAQVGPRDHLARAARTQLGEIYLKAGDRHGASECAEKIQAIYGAPYTSGELVFLRDFYRVTDQPEPLFQLVKTWLSQSPHDADDDQTMWLDLGLTFAEVLSELGADLQAEQVLGAMSERLSRNRPELGRSVRIAEADLYCRTARREEALIKMEHLLEEDLSDNERVRLLALKASCHHEREQYGAARDCFVEIVRINQKTLGPEHFDTLVYGQNIAMMDLELGRAEVAVTSLSALLPKIAERVGEDHWLVSQVHYGIGKGLRLLGFHEEALSHLQEAYMGYADAFGAVHPKTLSAEREQLRCFAAMENQTRFDALYEESEKHHCRLSEVKEARMKDFSQITYHGNRK